MCEDFVCVKIAVQHGDIKDYKKGFDETLGNRNHVIVNRWQLITIYLCN